MSRPLAPRRSTYLPPAARSRRDAPDGPAGQRIRIFVRRNLSLLILSTVTFSSALVPAAATPVGAVSTKSSTIANNTFDSGGRIHDYGIAEVTVTPAGGGQLARDKYAVVNTLHRTRSGATAPFIQPGQSVVVTTTLPEGAEYYPFTSGVRTEWDLPIKTACIDMDTAFYKSRCVAEVRGGRTTVTKTITVVDSAYLTTFWNQVEATSIVFHMPESVTGALSSAQVAIRFPNTEHSTLPTEFTQPVTILGEKPSTFGAYESAAVPNNPTPAGAWRVGDRGKFVGNPQPTDDVRPLSIRRGESIVLRTGIRWAEPTGHRSENAIYYDPTTDPAHPVSNVCTRTPPDGFSTHCSANQYGFLQVVVQRTGADTNNAFAAAAPVEIPVARSDAWFDDSSLTQSAPFAVTTSSSIGAVSNYALSTLDVPLAPSGTARIANATVTVDNEQDPNGMHANVSLTADVAKAMSDYTVRLTFDSGIDIDSAPCAEVPSGCVDRYVRKERVILALPAAPGPMTLPFALRSLPDVPSQATVLIELVDPHGKAVDERRLVLPETAAPLRERGEEAIPSVPTAAPSLTPTVIPSAAPSPTPTATCSPPESGDKLGGPEAEARRDTNPSTAPTASNGPASTASSRPRNEKLCPSLALP